MGFIGRYLDGLEAEERDRVITTAFERWGNGSYSVCLVGIASGAAQRINRDPMAPEEGYDDSWGPEIDCMIDDHHRQHEGRMDRLYRRPFTMTYQHDNGSFYQIREPYEVEEEIEDRFDAAFARAQRHQKEKQLIAAIKARAAKPHRVALTEVQVQEEVAV